MKYRFPSCAFHSPMGSVSDPLAAKRNSSDFLRHPVNNYPFRIKKKNNSKANQLRLYERFIVLNLCHDGEKTAFSSNMRTCSGSPFQAFLMYSLFHSNIRQLFMLYLNFSPYHLTTSILSELMDCEASNSCVLNFSHFTHMMNGYILHK